MKIDGIQVQNYRSFDGKGVDLSNLGKINLFIGQNNSGKSNILNIIANLYKLVSHNSNTELFQREDYFAYEKAKSITFQILHKNGGTLDSLLTNVEEMDRCIKKKDIWLKYAPNIERNKYSLDSSDITWFREILPKTSAEMTSLRGKILNNATMTDSALITKELFNKVFLEKEFITKEIYFITNFRKIEKKNVSENYQNYSHLNENYNGANLISNLNKIIGASASESKESEIKLQKIETFIRSVTNFKDAQIKINRDENEISIKANGRQVRLENLGSGFHQLLILAISVTIVENSIFCIEEPETFLHPETQKKFMNYLLETNNQYFISTHSNSFINIDGIDIFHVTHDGDKSSIERLISSQHKNQMLDDLGYHASDLLQSNYILWVEGPSDRIYINNWIKNTDPTLLEGIHYSIMFYGGALRSHLKVDNNYDENIIQNFILLNRINRHVGIVQDSDYLKENDSINKTKQRLIEEFKKEGYFNWLTEGRTIENYLSSETLENCVKNLVSEKAVVNQGKYDNVTTVLVNGKEKKLDKIILAKETNKYPIDFKQLKLGEKLNELVASIKLANKI